MAVGYDEKGKPGPGLINAGCYLMRRHDLDNFTLNKPFSLEKEFLLPAISEAKFNVFVTDGLFIDIGVPEDCRLAQAILNNKI